MDSNFNHHNANSSNSIFHICAILLENPENISAIKDWPVQTNVKKLHQFLGFICYRRLLKDFDKIIAPLNSLLKGQLFYRNTSWMPQVKGM